MRARRRRRIVVAMLATTAGWRLATPEDGHPATDTARARSHRREQRRPIKARLWAIHRPEVIEVGHPSRNQVPPSAATTRDIGRK